MLSVSSEFHGREICSSLNSSNGCFAAKADVGSLPAQLLRHVSLPKHIFRWSLLCCVNSAPSRRATINCRVSVNNRGRDRHLVELLKFADRAGDEIVETFAEIVSAVKTSTKDRVERA